MTLKYTEQTDFGRFEICGDFASVFSDKQLKTPEKKEITDTYESLCGQCEKN